MSLHLGMIQSHYDLVRLIKVSHTLADMFIEVELARLVNVLTEFIGQAGQTMLHVWALCRLNKVNTKLMSVGQLNQLLYILHNNI